MTSSAPARPFLARSEPFLREKILQTGVTVKNGAPVFSCQAGIPQDFLAKAP